MKCKCKVTKKNEIGSFKMKIIGWSILIVIFFSYFCNFNIGKKVYL